MAAQQQPGPFTPPTIVVRRMHRRFARLDPSGVRAFILDLIKDEWVRMALEDATVGGSGEDMRILGLFAMRFSTGGRVVPTAALLIQLRRHASPGRPEREIMLMVFLGADLRKMKVAWREGHAFPAANYIGGPGEVLKGAGPFTAADQTDGHPLEAREESGSAPSSPPSGRGRAGTAHKRRATPKRAARQRRRPRSARPAR